MTSPKNEQQCIFCLAAASSDSRETLTLFRDELVLVMLNRYPYTNGHVMVAPLSHTAMLTDTDDDVLFAVIRMTAEAQRILAETYRTDGFNIGMNVGQAGGAGFAEHYHMHVVPRWSGDSNFMTVTAQTRLVPEALDTTFEKLQSHFARLGTLARRRNE